MIDPELKYCPKCKDEYRAEIIVCAACEATLLTGLEMLARQREGEGKRSSRKGSLTETDDLVAVRRGPLGELRAYEQLLKAEGIATLMAGDEKSCGKGCCAGNFDLVVRREDAAEAVKLIEAEIRRTAQIDIGSACHHDAVFHDEAVETTCPACGHKFPPSPECPDCGLCF
jgi:uncharacterized Zn ribbon protein